MKISACLKFTKSLVFPKSERDSSASKSMRGSVLCIAISLVPLVMVCSISTGLINGMTERIIGLSSSHIQAYVARDPEIMGNAQVFSQFARELCASKGVTAVYPQVTSNALASSNGYRTGAQVRALEPSIFQENLAFSSLFEVKDGNLLDFSAGTKTCVVGEKLAQLISVKSGDSFSLITTKNINDKIVPKLTRLKVAAVVSSGYQELDSLWVFVPLDTGYQFLPLKSSVFSVMIETEDAFSPYLSLVRKELQREFHDYANFYTWNEVNSAQFENFSSTKVMLLVVMILIVLVACVNISSSLVMLVMERRKEIAILKSIGARRGGITLSFVAAGFTLGGLGVLFGIPVGVLLSLKSNEIVFGMEKLLNAVMFFFYKLRGIPSDYTVLHLMDPSYYMTRIPVVIPWGEIGLVAVSALVLSVVVSFVPSYRAGRESTSELFMNN